MSKDKWTSAGGVVIDDMKNPINLYVCKPSNNYGPWCFPKGRVDGGENKEEAALREVMEETGIPARLLPNGFLGTGIGSCSITHYFMMERIGPIGSHDFEMEEIRLVNFDEARELFSSDGNSRDIGILDKVIAYIANVVKTNESIDLRHRWGRISGILRG